MSEREITDEIDAILDETAQRISALLARRFNETCSCPVDHEIAISTWAFAYEYVSMREGGSPVPSVEVIHSTRSHAHASGLLRASADLVELSILSVEREER